MTDFSEPDLRTMAAAGFFSQSLYLVDEEAEEGRVERETKNTPPAEFYFLLPDEELTGDQKILIEKIWAALMQIGMQYQPIKIGQLADALNHQPKLILSFGCQQGEFAFQPLHKPLQVQNTQLILTLPIARLEKEATAKRELWNSLKALKWT